MQYCIPPILVEVLAPHFAVRYSCRSVLVFFGFVCFILPPILVEVLASRFAVAILLSFIFSVFLLCSVALFLPPVFCGAKLYASCQVALISSLCVVSICFLRSIVLLVLLLTI